MRRLRFKHVLLTFLAAAAALCPLASAQPAAAMVLNGLPDLTVRLTAAPNPVSASGAVTYTLEINNSSTEKCNNNYPEPTCNTFGQAVSGAAVRLTLPTGARYQSGAGDHGFVCPTTSSGSTVTCTGGSLGVDEWATVTIKVTAPGTAGAATAQATADPNNAIAEVSESNNAAATSVTISPAGPRAYVRQTPGMVGVIETQTNTLINTVAIAPDLTALALKPGNARLYATSATDSTLRQIDTASLAVVGQLALGQQPNALAFTPDGGRVYVAGQTPNGGEVAIVDTNANNVTARVNVGPATTLYDILVSPDGSRAYVSWSTSDYSYSGASVIDTASNTLIASLPAVQNTRGARLALSPDGRRLYIVAVGDTLAIDTASLSVLAHLGVGDGTQSAVSPDGTRLYLAERNEGYLAVFDTRTNSTIKMYGGGASFYGPYSVAASADGTQFFAAWPDNDFCRFDAITLNPQGCINVPAGPNGIALLPPAPHARAYVANMSSNSISVIDRVSQQSLATLSVGSQPDSVAVAPDGRHSYVANYASNSVSVLNTATMSVAGTVPVGTHPSGIAINPDSTRVYVTNAGSNTLSVIDAASNALLATVGTGTSPNKAAVSPDGRWVYVSNNGSGNVTVVDTTTNSGVGTIKVGGNPAGLAFSADGHRVYVASPRGGSGGVAVIDTATRTVVTSIALPYAAGVGVAPNGARIYVSQPNSSKVAVLDAQTNTVQTSIAVGSAPTGLSLNEDGGRLFVTDPTTNKLYVVDTNNNSTIASVSVGSAPRDVALEV